MLIKDEAFRNLYKSYVIIKNEKFSRQIAQTLQIDSIMEDGISSDELKERLDSIEIDEKINAIFAIAYIDHSAGMSFLTLSVAHLDGRNVEISKRERFDALSIFRKGDVNDCEFEYLENLNADEGFEIDEYREFSKLIEGYHVNDNVEMLRFAYELDSSRNEDYPDDVGVLFIKEGLQIEKMWVRYDDLTKDRRIIGTLLNTPYQEFGVEAGEKVEFFPYKPNEDEEWVLICDLNKEVMNNG